MAEELRFSRRVPDNAVNLAWIQIPPLSAQENLSLVETSRYIAENINLAWQRSLGAGVQGYNVATDSTSGLLLLTTYNAAPSGISASGAISSGIASYQLWREATPAVTPSGFVVDNFTAEIRVQHPQPDDTGVWRLRVQDGVIVREQILRASDRSWLANLYAPGDELVLFYSIPEAVRIPYLTGDLTLEDARVVDVSGVIGTIIDENTIQFPDEDLYELRSLKLNGRELVQPVSGTLRVATPTASGLLPPRGVFTAWDPMNGTVTLAQSLNESDEVVAAYRYREYLYLYEGYQDDLGVYHDLDLNPSPGHSYDGARATDELLNIPVYLYLLPTAAYRTKDAGGNIDQERRIYSGTRWTNSFLRWERTVESVANHEDAPATDPNRHRWTYGHAYFGQATFTTDLTVDNVAASLAATGAVLANLPSAVILAKCYVTSNAQVGNVRLVDSRVRGGGLPETVDPKSSALPGTTRQEVETYWDVAGWDGQPVPLAGVVLVELPGDLLTGANNYPQFTQAEIEAIVQAHIGAGVKAVVRYL